MANKSPDTESPILPNECIEQLGLQQNPFTEHAGDIYIYSDSHTEITTNVILENLEKSGSTIVICGDQGIGKTTYLRKLLRKGYQRYQFCTLRAKSHMTFQDICDKIVQRWIMYDANSEDTSSNSIEDYVVSYLGDRNHGVIIIDDADRLGVEVINELLTLKHRVSLVLPNRLGLVITGKNTISLMLSELEGVNPAANQIYQVNIRPFNKEQTVKYVKFRLKNAIVGEEEILTEDEIEGIHDASRGIPREIHRFAISSLRNKCLDQGIEVFADDTVVVNNSSPNFMRLAILLGVPLVAAIAVFIYQKPSPEPQVELVLPQLETHESSDTASTVTKDANASSAEPAVTLPSPDNKPELESRTISSLEEQAKVLQALQETTVSEVESKIAEIEATAPQAVAENPIPTSDKPVHEATNVVDDKPEQLIVDQKPPEEEIRPTTVTKPVPAVSQTTGVSWLRQLNSQHYCLQLLASAEEKPLKELVQRVHLTKEYAIYVKTVKGIRWHVLVAGDYPNKQSAIAAIGNLPEPLKRNKPWPVSVNSIQSQL